jgi:hypothetical protein
MKLGENYILFHNCKFLLFAININMLVLQSVSSEVLRVNKYVETRRFS